MTCELIAAGDGRLCLKGDVRMDTAATVLAQAQPQVGTGDLVLDLADVGSVDSAVLSVVLSLLRTAKAGGRKLSIANTPPAFDSLAELYGVDALLAEYLDAGTPAVHA
jgi:phospholipid transport system transporter-binding protein